MAEKVPEIRPAPGGVPRARPAALGPPTDAGSCRTHSASQVKIETALGHGRCQRMHHTKRGRTMPVKSVQDLLLNELRDLYDTEKQLVKALPKVAKAASSEQLRQAIGEHLEETKAQVQRPRGRFRAPRYTRPRQTLRGDARPRGRGNQMMEEPGRRPHCRRSEGGTLRDCRLWVRASGGRGLRASAGSTAPGRDPGRGKAAA
jgi:ElaB/YqjD/DUF883 family membrane-anchored ribosome-binding protein